MTRALTLAAIAAAALLDPSWAHENVRRLAEEREWLAARLRDAGWPVHPSVTNFLLVRIRTPENAEEASERLLQAGIVPRTFGPANPLRGHLRLTVRSAPENDRLLEVLGAR